MNTVQRLTFIASTKEVVVNGEKYKIKIEKVEPENLRAIQWYGASESPWGEMEFEGENNTQFFEFALIQSIYEMWMEAKALAAEEYAEIKRLEDIEAGRYENLRVQEYPSLSSQIGAMMSMLDSMVKDSDKTPEFKELISAIAQVKEKYPKPDETPVKSAKKKNK